METKPKASMSELEKELQSKFSKKKVYTTSDAKSNTGETRLDKIALPDAERGGLPITKEKYVIRENVNLVAWEREVRKFLRKLPLWSPHRISASMVWEWVTGINVADLYNNGGNANADMRHIHKILRFYFGTPSNTYIAGKKVERAYKVPKNWGVKYHRPLTLTLWVEWKEGTLVA